MTAKKKPRRKSHPANPRIHRIQFCAIKIDETGHYNQGELSREYGQWAPTRLWSVYIIRPNQPSYVASPTPQSFAMHAYSGGELPDGAPKEIREKLSEDLMMTNHDDGYLDFRMVQGLIKEGRDSRDLGMFVTTDETLDECRDAWGNALECLRVSRIL